MASFALDPFDDEDEEDENAPIVGAPTCRVCGCAAGDPCVDEEGEVCHWVTPTLCSACLEL